MATLFDLAAKITLDDKNFQQGIKNGQKSMNEYKKDVMNLAQTYKKQGMDMSSAMKRAYSEIDKSQYTTAEKSKSDSKKFFKNWDESGEKVKNMASKLGSGLKTAAKVGGTAIAAAATGIAALTTKSVQSYAEYEQLVGGVDKLFKDSSKKIQGYAEQAYKTAGMSANDYMETVTGFSASLISSLEGDTEKAADYANRALTDMSDNANTFGTDLESIKYAYGGFAKQNYTMLKCLAA